MPGREKTCLCGFRPRRTQTSLHSYRGLQVSIENAEVSYYHTSLVVRKPAFCICENKDADQLRGNREADQRLCFRYSDSTIPLLPLSVIPSLQPSSVAVQPGLCRTWSETPKTGFLRTRLVLSCLQRTSKALISLCGCTLMLICSFVDQSERVYTDADLLLC